MRVFFFFSAVVCELPIFISAVATPVYILTVNKSSSSPINFLPLDFFYGSHPDRDEMELQSSLNWIFPMAKDIEHI